MNADQQKLRESLLRQLALSPKHGDEHEKELSRRTRQLHEKSAFWITTVVLLFAILCAAVIVAYVSAERRGMLDPNLLSNLPDHRWGNQHNLPNAPLTTMAVNDRELLVGTAGNGLHVYDKATRLWSTYRDGEPGKALPSDELKLVKFDEQNPEMVWALTEGGGLGFVENAARGDWQTLFGATPFPGLHDTLITSAARNGALLALGTRNQGVGLYDLRRKEWIAHVQQPQQALPSNRINLVRAGAEANEFWAGTPNGLVRIKNNEIARTFLTSSIYHDVSDVEARPEEVWYLTRGNFSLGRVRSGSKHEVLIQANAMPVPAKEFTDAAQAGDQLWVGTRRNGLLLYDMNSRQWRNLRSSAGSSLRSNRIATLAFNAESNELFVGSDSGLGILSEEQAKNPKLEDQWPSFRVGRVKEIRFDGDDAYFLTASGKLGVRQKGWFDKSLAILTDSSTAGIEAEELISACEEGEVLYSGAKDGGIFKYDKNSHAWSGPYFPDYYSRSAIEHLAYNPHNETKLALTENRIYLAQASSSIFGLAAHTYNLPKKVFRVIPASTGFIMLGDQGQLVRFRQSDSSVATLLTGGNAPGQRSRFVSLDTLGSQIYFATDKGDVHVYNTVDHRWETRDDIQNVAQIRSVGKELLYQTKEGGLRVTNQRTLIGSEASALRDEDIRNAADAGNELWAAGDRFIEKYDKETHTWLRPQRIPLRGRGAPSDLFVVSNKPVYRTGSRGGDGGELWLEGRRLAGEVGDVAGIGSKIWYAKGGDLYQTPVSYYRGDEQPVKIIHSQGFPKLPYEHLAAAAEFNNGIWMATNRRLLIYDKTQRTWSAGALPEGRSITELQTTGSFLYTLAEGAFYRMSAYPLQWARISPLENTVKDFALFPFSATLLLDDGSLSRVSTTGYFSEVNVLPKALPAPLDLNHLVNAWDDSASNLYVVNPHHLLHYDKSNHAWSAPRLISEEEVIHAEFQNQRVWAHCKDGSIWVGSLQGEFARFLPGRIDRAGIDLNATVDALEVDQEIFLASPQRVEVYSLRTHSWLQPVVLENDAFQQFLTGDKAVMFVTQAGMVYEYIRAPRKWTRKGLLPLSSLAQLAVEDDGKIWALDRAGAVHLFKASGTARLSSQTIISGDSLFIDPAKIVDAGLSGDHLWVQEDARLLRYDLAARRWSAPITFASPIREFVARGVQAWVLLQDGKALLVDEQGRATVKANFARDLEKFREGSYGERVAALTVDAILIWNAEEPNKETQIAVSPGALQRLMTSDDQTLVAIDKNGRLHKAQLTSPPQPRMELLQQFAAVPLNVAALLLDEHERAVWYLLEGQLFRHHGPSNKKTPHALPDFAAPEQRFRLSPYRGSSGVRITAESGETCVLETRSSWKVMIVNGMVIPFEVPMMKFKIEPRAGQTISGRGLLEDFGYEATTGKFRGNVVRSLEVYHDAEEHVWLVTDAGLYRYRVNDARFPLLKIQQAVNGDFRKGKLLKGLIDEKRKLLYEEPGRAMFMRDNANSWRAVNAGDFKKARLLIDTPLWRWTRRDNRLDIQMKDAKLAQGRPIYDPGTGKFFFDEVQNFAPVDEGLWVQTPIGPCFYPYPQSFGETVPTFKQKLSNQIKKRLAGEREAIWVNTRLWKWGISQGKPYVKLKTRNEGEIDLRQFVGDSLTAFPFDRIHALAHDSTNLWLATDAGAVRFPGEDWDNAEALEIYRMKQQPKALAHAHFPNGEYHLVCRTEGAFPLDLQFNRETKAWIPLPANPGGFNPFTETLLVNDGLWRWSASRGQVHVKLAAPAMNNLEALVPSDRIWGFRFDRVAAMMQTGSALFLIGEGVISRYRTPVEGLTLSGMELWPGPAFASNEAVTAKVQSGNEIFVKLQGPGTRARTYQSNARMLALYNRPEDPFAQRTLIDNGFWRWTLNHATSRVSKMLLATRDGPVELRMAGGRFAFDDFRSFAIGGGHLWLATSSGVARYPLSSWSLPLNALRFEAFIAGQRYPSVSAINVRGDSIVFCEAQNQEVYHRKLADQVWHETSTGFDPWKRQPVASTFWTWTEEVKSHSVQGLYRDAGNRAQQVQWTQQGFTFDAVHDLAWANEQLWLATEAGLCKYPGQDALLNLEHVQVYRETPRPRRVVTVPPGMPIAPGVYAADASKSYRFEESSPPGQWQEITPNAALQNQAGYSGGDYLAERFTHETLVDYDGFWRCRRRTPQEEDGGLPPLLLETRAAGFWQRVSFQKGQFDFDHVRGFALEQPYLWLATRAGVCRYDLKKDRLDLNRMKPYWGPQWENATEVLLQPSQATTALVIRRGSNNNTVAALDLSNPQAQLQNLTAGENPFARQTRVLTEYWHWLDQEELAGNVAVGPRLALELREASGAWTPIDLQAGNGILPFDQLAAMAHHKEALWLATPAGVFRYPDDRSLSLAHAAFYSANGELTGASNLLVSRNQKPGGELFCETGAGKARRIFYFDRSEKWTETASLEALEEFRFQEDQWYWYEQEGRLRIRYQNDPVDERRFFRGHFADHFILSATTDSSSLWCVTPVGIFRYAGHPGQDSLRTLAWLNENDLVGVPSKLQRGAKTPYSILRDRKSLWMLTADGLLRFQAGFNSNRLVFAAHHWIVNRRIDGGQLFRDHNGRLAASLHCSGKRAHFIALHADANLPSNAGRAQPVWQSPSFFLPITNDGARADFPLAILQWDSASSAPVFDLPHAALTQEFYAGMSRLRLSGHSLDADVIVALGEDAERVWLAKPEGIYEVNKKTAQRILSSSRLAVNPQAQK